MNITFIGTGYVGLVSGTCFADMGFNVTCVDKDEAKIKALKDEHKIPIYEPGLEELVIKNTKAGRLNFTTDLSECVPNSDAVFLAVGTPQGDDGRADLKYIFAAAQEVAHNLKDFTVVVTKSTVPVGTNRRVAATIRQANPDADFAVASNPEFLREGAAIGDFMQPDRVVIGAEKDSVFDVMRQLYLPLTTNGAKMIETNLETAEMIKYAANAFLATKITFINEIAALCDKVGANVMDVADGMGTDARIGRAFLNAGPGYGGSCFPKDTNALAATGFDNNARLNIVETVIKTNRQLKKDMAKRVKAAVGGTLHSKRICLLGLAFKADTDDMRDSPAIDIATELQKAGAFVTAYDPQAMNNAKAILPDIKYYDDLWTAAKGADAAVIVTEWDEFKNMELAKLAESLAQPVLVDLRNLFKPEQAQDKGLKYSSIGRPQV